MKAPEFSAYSPGSLRKRSTGYCHEALLYAGESEFVESTSAFIREGLEAEEPALVVVGARKVDLLKQALGPDATSVQFADMAELGVNPARIIPAWQAFLDDHASDGGPVRGVGEPISPERSPAAVVESQRHEQLLNLAFATTLGFWLLCPYDMEALDHDVLVEATRSHPFILEGGIHSDSAAFQLLDPAEPFDEPLADPPTRAEELRFDADSLVKVREFVARAGLKAGLRPLRVADLVFAANEVASNSVRHGGGAGTAGVWSADGEFVCEVADRGYIDEPLVGRERPAVHKASGRGLWLVNHLCDLVEVRSFDSGTVVRLHMALDRAAGN